MAWLGLKTLAFIPLTRSNVPQDVPPPDWADQIRQRVFFDPAIDPNTRQPTDTDRSVRAYITLYRLDWQISMWSYSYRNPSWEGARTERTFHPMSFRRQRATFCGPMASMARRL
jgi:hypothetical protein